LIRAVSHEHVSLPVRIPDLTYLTNEELQALRSKVGSMTRDARKKANLIIQKYPDLRDAWMKSLGVKIDDPDRDAVFQAMERRLLHYPDAFLAHAYVNSLFVLDAAFRDEMLRRSLPGNGKKKAKPHTPPPEPTLETRPPWEVLDDDASPRDT
jgi:hypothetical protein